MTVVASIVASNMAQAVWSQEPYSTGESRWAAAAILLIVAVGLILTFALLRLVGLKERQRRGGENQSPDEE